MGATISTRIARALALAASAALLCASHGARAESEPGGDAAPDIISFHELGYPTAALTSASPEFEAWKEVPGNQRLLPGSTVELTLAYPATTDDAEEHLIVTLNGDEIGRHPLDPAGRARDRVVLALPAPPGQPQGLHLVVRYAAADAPTTRRSVTIKDTSAIHLRQAPRPVVADLAAWPYPFAYPRADGAIPLAFALPAPPTVAETDAAAVVAAAIGRHAGDSKLDIIAVPLADVDPTTIEGRHVIALGTRDRLRSAPWIAGQPAATAGSRAASTLQLSAAPWNPARGLLIVTGDDADGLQAAARALGSATSVLAGEVLSFKGRPPQTPAPPDPWGDADAPFSDFAVGDITFRGPGHHSQTLYFPRPRGWALDTESRLVMHASPGPAVRGRAALTMALNGAELGGVPPEILASSGDYRWEAAFPPGVGTGRRARADDFLVVTITADLGEATGDVAADGGRWLTVFADSAFALVPKAPPLPDLGVMPYPFVPQRSDAPPVAVLLPPVASAGHQAIGLAAAAMLGRGASDLVPVRMREVGPFSAAAATGHLILVGPTGDNPWLVELRAVFPYAAWDPPAKAQAMTAVGRIAEVLSPWSDGDVILTLSAGAEHAPAMVSALSRREMSGAATFINRRGHMVPPPSGRAPAAALGRAVLGADTCADASAATSPLVFLLVGLIVALLGVIGGMRLNHRRYQRQVRSKLRRLESLHAQSELLVPRTY